MIRMPVGSIKVIEHLSFVSAVPALVAYRRVY